MLPYQNYIDGSSYAVLLDRNQMLLIFESLKYHDKYGLASAKVWYIPVCSRSPMNQVSGSTFVSFDTESSHEPYVKQC